MADRARFRRRCPAKPILSSPARPSSPRNHSSADRQLVCFMRADAYGLIHLGYEDVAIVNRAGSGHLDNGRGDGAGQCVGHHDFQLDFGLKIRRAFPTAILVNGAISPSAGKNFAHGHAVNAKTGQGIPHFFQLERFDEGFDFLHGVRFG